MNAENIASQIRQAIEMLNNALGDAAQLGLRVDWAATDTFTAGEFSEYALVTVASISREEIL